MRVDYGLVTPFGSDGQSPSGRRLQAGLLLSRLGPVGREVSGERAALRHPGRDDYRMRARPHHLRWRGPRAGEPVRGAGGAPPART